MCLEENPLRENVDPPSKQQQQQQQEQAASVGRHSYERKRRRPWAANAHSTQRFGEKFSLGSQATKLNNSA
ncbi:hypothetical protein NECAME_07454 [Necator americanus]|uniref:Uncharacterized protein n=1 Tax=Necator americanus TaxID=51031 RepID=W2TQE5_NECAM|nr:hypothetical protein NECAME_07454 [Necator americanus]ETN83336.1 hypothetical protein NECAME_07454 [Necator americanus]